MKFLCTTCHREHGLSADEISACRAALASQAPGEGMAAYRAAAERRANSSTSAAARLAEAYVRARKAGCPDLALGTLLRRPQETPAFAAAQRWITHTAAWSLTLLGPPGVGKTVAACHVVVDFCKRWEWNSGSTGTRFEPCLYVQVSELARLSLFEDADKERYASMQSARLLVLDDAGDEVTDFGSKALIDLLIDRHKMRRRTVLCANLSAEALRQRYGGAIVDRFKEGMIPSLQSQLKSMRQRSPT